MARFRRSRSRGRRSGRSRKVRWNGSTFSTAVDLQNSPAHGLEYITWWIKFPASTLVPANSMPIGGTPSAPFNEPVDETLVRLRVGWQIYTAGQSVTGNAAQGTAVFGIIPFNGGEFPDFYDFSIFQLGVSLVAPPNPITNVDDPWVYRVGLSYSTEDPATADTETAPESYVDVRSMRKLPAGVGLMAVLGVANLLNPDTGSTTVRFDGDVRYAVKSGFSL